ncbi:SusC/RagA family TonB-linked outer membrane protein [Chitinophaga sp. CC14]|uniref:SusC/RagA family TonB-linked outer membrane protein n=1 Tax=Chitinophaga sp. CC14 TaxID=3029199 RepID=UPI003B76201B
MLLLVLLICFICLKLSAVALAQGITIAVRNAPIATVFSLIEKQTDYIFWYDKDQVRFARPVTLNLKNSALPRVLEACFKGQPFTYLIGEKSITVKAKQQGILKQSPKMSKDTLIRGKVQDEQGNPLSGVSVKVKGTATSAMTNTKGNFSILLRTDHFSDWVLVFSFIGYKTEEVKLTGKNEILVALKEGKRELQEVNVTVNTGYQTLPKERATGSFSYVDNKLFNRSVGTNIINRLDGVTSGLTFNKLSNKTGGLSSNGGDPGISIRGRSTLFANTEPLIVLDNFPYEGDLANINPNDIESVTVLKDAAAASIWGVRAGNGVIVLTSKKGKANQVPKVSFNTNITVTGKPDLYSVPQMTSKEYIELEKYWFYKGKYNPYLNIPIPVFTSYPISPVIEILGKERKGSLSHTEAEAQLDYYRSIDSRDDYTKYFLRNAVNQQYALNITGGLGHHQYYLSGGYDRNLDNIVSNSYNRINLTANNSFIFLKDRLKLDANIFFTKSKTRSNPDTYNIDAPYLQVVGSEGNAISVTRDYRPAAKDNLVNQGLLDWNYYPYNERLNNNNESDLTDYRLSLQLNYKILPKYVNVNVSYLYQQGNSAQNVIRRLDSYSTRNLINQVTQISSTGELIHPIPLGAIADFSDSNYQSNSGRASINYNQIFGTKHEINAIAGAEIKDYTSFNKFSRLYGYYEATATAVTVDYFRDFPIIISNGNFRIPNPDSQGGISDRFLSYFTNASYTYDKKYTLSASARKDESNLFGVDANKKGVPLYSLGLSWVISQEDFFKTSLLAYLRFRFTDGYNGNLSKALSSYTTSKVLANVNPDFYVPQQVIVNPPNPALRWERVHVMNAGIDFSSKNDIISGSIDFYMKKGEDLIGDSPIAPQSGLISFRGNTASILTKGLDFTLNSTNLKENFGWTSNFLFNYVKDKVTEYKMQAGANSNYVGQNYSNPFVGKPYSSLFAYQWAGLDGNGNPQGYLNGNLSKDYSAMLNSTDPGNLKYIGTGLPTFFGSLRNNFQYKGFELSFNLTFKFGYSFRRGSFTSSSGFRSADYANRWQKSGDEKKTDVPSLSYPADAQRDAFYLGSETLIERGDHLRLQDIRLSYTISNNHHTLPFQTLRLYGYASGLGLIWKANSKDLDPDYTGNGFYRPVDPRAFAIGLTANF